MASGGGGGAATGAGRDLGSFLCAMAFLLTVRHAGFAGPAAASSSGGGTASGAAGSGNYANKNKSMRSIIFALPQ